MMLRILVPIDFSENAWNATQYAIQFFEKQEVIFHFLYIDSKGRLEDEVDLYRSGFSISERNGNDPKNNMQRWMEHLYQLPVNSNHSYLNNIKNVPFIRGLRDYITEHQINFMILGTKGASGIKTVTIGSKTDEIITKIKCNALIIPEKASLTSSLNIAFLTDYNINFTTTVLDGLRRFAAYYMSAAKILRVTHNKEKLSDVQKRNRDYLKSQLEEINHSFHVVENKDLEDSFEAFTHKMQIGIVVMIAKNLNLFQKLLFTPKVAHFTYSTTIPFLILHG